MKNEESISTEEVDKRRDRSPFLYLTVFLALALIKALTRHRFVHPEGIQFISVIVLAVACYPLRPKPVKSLALYLVVVLALAAGWVYADRVSEILRGLAHLKAFVSHHN